MNPVAIAFAVAGLVLIAGAGVVSGFLREAPVPVEPLADPLEDRRAALLRSLADLDEAHAEGVLDEPEYARLRERSEDRMTRVLRAIDRREASATAVVVADAESDGHAPAAPVTEPRRVPPWAVAVLIGGTVLAVIVATLARDAGSQPQAAATPNAAAQDPLAFFEQRVRDHPDDLAARLDLAHRYVDAGQTEKALSQYAVALEMDPDDAEALAHVGLIFFQAERYDNALKYVDHALRTDPTYPEALFIRGVILLRGLHRPQDAIASFEDYLDAAPFGVERQTAQDLIDEARAALDQA